MNVVREVKELFEAGTDFAWRVFVIIVAFLVVEYLKPEWFLDLPDWILPVARAAAIPFTVLLLISFSVWLFKAARKLMQYLFLPISRYLYRHRLRDLNPIELVIVCQALVEQDRGIRANPDVPAIISLQNKGVLERDGALVFLGDGKSGFRIPLIVWELLLDMPEFHMERSEDFKKARDNEDETLLRKSLPEKHPAVQNLSR